MTPQKIAVYIEKNVFRQTETQESGKQSAKKLPWISSTAQVSQIKLVVVHISSNITFVWQLCPPPSPSFVSQINDVIWLRTRFVSPKILIRFFYWKIKSLSSVLWGFNLRGNCTGKSRYLSKVEPLIPPSSSPKLAQMITIFDNLDNRVYDSQGLCQQFFCQTAK